MLAWPSRELATYRGVKFGTREHTVLQQDDPHNGLLNSHLIHTPLTLGSPYPKCLKLEMLWFGIFWNFEYLCIYNKVSWVWDVILTKKFILTVSATPTSAGSMVFLHRSSLYTKPVDNCIQYFSYAWPTVTHVSPEVVHRYFYLWHPVGAPWFRFWRVLDLLSKHVQTALI